MCFCDVAKLLSKDPSSISKEVRKHFIGKEANHFNEKFHVNMLKVANVNTYARTATMNIFAKLIRAVNEQMDRLHFSVQKL